MTIKIKWLIAHEPVDLFLRTAEAFSQKIAELTNNKFEVEIITPSQAVNMLINNPRDPMAALENNDIQMSQLHISQLAQWHSPDFYALDLPFLFNDHDHAARVLEGDIGNSMLKGLATRSPATGMAFTYSGGFRCIVSDNPIDNINKLAGITFVTSHSPVNIDTVEALGAIPKPYFIADYAEKVKAEGADGEVLETTIPRYLSLFKDTNKRYMTNTKHSLFLTSIIVGNKFWESLDFDTQSKLQEACTYASRLERQWSVDDAEQFAAKSDHSDIGVSYRELSAAETAEFKELVSPIVEKYKDFFTPDLVDGIIRA